MMWNARVLALRVLIMVAAFAAAVLIAALVFTAAILLPLDVGNAPGGVMADIGAMLQLALLVAIFAAISIALPVLALMLIAEWRRWRDAAVHWVSGSIIGLFSTALWAQNPGDRMALNYLAGAASGLAGALVYWAIAGRNAGRWREDMR